MTLNSNPLSKVSKNMLMILLDPLAILYSEYVTIMAQNYLRKIKVTFSDLRDHRFNHNFNCDNPRCSCGMEDETTIHFFLRCPHYVSQRSNLLSKISDIISSHVTVFPDEHLYHMLIYGGNVYNSVSNGLITTETIKYIRNSGRFTKLEAFR